MGQTCFRRARSAAENLPERERYYTIDWKEVLHVLLAIPRNDRIVDGGQFVLLYLNSYAADHVFFSETRTYMALYMGAAMAVIMLAFMLGMYADVIGSSEAKLQRELAVAKATQRAFGVPTWNGNCRHTMDCTSFIGRHLLSASPTSIIQFFCGERLLS